MARSTRGADGSLPDSIVHQLRRAMQAASAAWAEQLPDMTPPQFAVLFALSRGDGLSQSELGERVSMDISTLTPLLDRLEGRGLVHKSIDQLNRRRRRIVITGEGEKELTRAKVKVDVVERRIESALGPEEAHQLLRTLGALGDAVTRDAADQ